jgi:hypothetical protein
MCRDAWLGHPAFKIVGNENDFKTKINNASKFFCDYLKQPSPHANSVRYFVRMSDFIPKDLKITEVTLESHYILLRQDSVPEEKVSTDYVLRKRTQNETSSYSLSAMTIDELGKEIITTTKVLRKQDFDLMLMQADPTKLPVIRLRKSFAWKLQYFELDFWNGENVANNGSSWLKVRDIKSDCAIMNVDVDDPSKIVFPPFVEVLEDITKTYSLKKMAAKS